MKTRFAPSPTGLLHFGNIRTALFNVLASRSLGGDFLLRIEDTDRDRSKDEYVQSLRRDLQWLGLDWQEGPGVSSDDASYFQSARTAIYEKHLEALLAQDMAYPCFCSAVELEVSRKTQAAQGRPPRYSGKCASLKHEEVARKKGEGLPYTLRFRVGRGASIDFVDLVRGPQHFASDDIGDFIIKRSDGSFAFFFVNAVDDALMAVTHVLRGEDHLTNTPRQLAILKTLGLPQPEYGHISLIVDAKGAPLSKRSGSLSVEELRGLGYLPLSIVNYLARLGHNYAENRLMTLDELAQGFLFSSLGKAPARYDRSQLDYWQAQAVAAASDEALAAWMAEAVGGLVPAGEMADFVAAVRGNVVFPPEAGTWAQAVYLDPMPLSDPASDVIKQAGSEFFRLAAEALKPEDDFSAFTKALKAASGASGKGLFMPLRAALTGQIAGPEMPPLFKLIGFERAHARLARLAR